MTALPTPGVDASDLGVFYDPLSYAAYDHPYEVCRQLRDSAPVYYNALQPGTDHQRG